jgi:uncharacterized protein (DUF305 family)
MSDEILTKAWLKEKLEADRAAAETVEEERREEQAFEDVRQAWVQQTGVEPTWDELKKALQEKRNQDVAYAARLNEAQARRAIHQQF